MPSRKPASRSIRLLLALLFIIAAPVSVSVATQHSAVAASPCALPSDPQQKQLGGETGTEYTYYLLSSAPCSTTLLSKSHRCVSIATYNNEQAVQCADVAVQVASGGQVDVWGVGTFYCQVPGSTIQCAFMNVSVEFAYRVQVPDFGTGTQTEPATNYSCPVNGCTSGKAQVGSGHFAAASGTQTCIESWGVDLAGIFGSQVQLQDDPRNDTYTSNFSSAHVNVCIN